MVSRMKNGKIKVDDKINHRLWVTNKSEIALRAREHNSERWVRAANVFTLIYSYTT